MQHEEYESCATKIIPMKMFCLCYSGVSGSCCYKPWEPPLSSLHLSHTDKYGYFLLGPVFLHRADTLTGYSVAFCRCRCTDLACLPWHCPPIQIVFADIPYPAVWEVLTDSVHRATNSLLSRAPHTPGRPSFLFLYPFVVVLSVLPVAHAYHFVHLSHTLPLFSLFLSLLSLPLALK